MGFFFGGAASEEELDTAVEEAASVEEAVSMEEAEAEPARAADVEGPVVMAAVEVEVEAGVEAVVTQLVWHSSNFLVTSG